MKRRKRRGAVHPERRKKKRREAKPVAAEEWQRLKKGEGNRHDETEKEEEDPPARMLRRGVPDDQGDHPHMNGDTMTRDELDIRKAVKENYGRLAGKQSSCCSSDCCGAEQQNRLGYTREQLSSIPGEAKEVSAGCGNPMAAAGVAEGQTVLDLGSGGGIDVFLAARVVGPHGRAIGVDATPEMVWRARETAQKSNIGNVEFRLGEIEHLPVESESVDVIISNCVINLSPDKKQVFREAFRTLKRGGTLAVSDIVLLERLPEIIEEHMPSWVECVAGAMLEKDYTGAMVEAGFQDIEIISRHTYTREQIESFFYSSREEELDEAFLDAARKEVDRIRIASSIVVARKPDK